METHKRITTTRDTNVDNIIRCRFGFLFITESTLIPSTEIAQHSSIVRVSPWLKVC
jgi:hypothetical protein